jgi:hypothetical protein
MSQGLDLLQTTGNWSLKSLEDAGGSNISIKVVSLGSCMDFVRTC